MEQRFGGHHIVSKFGTRLRDDINTVILEDSDLVVFYRCCDGATAE